VPRLWDDSLYAGSAEFYLQGRLPYPERLAAVLRERVGLDGSGRLLDLGCGPGSLTLLLAPCFRDVVAVDADEDMLRVGRTDAARREIANVRWLHAPAEDLGGVGRFDVVTLAQSFHWMDRPLVAGKIRGLLEPGGYCVHVGATTHEGTGSAGGSPHPTVPRQAIRELIEAYLGPQRRAGQGVVVGGYTPEDEESVFRAAGFSGPEVVIVPGGEVFERSQDQVVASVLSLSYAAPHLFGGQLAAFVGRLRALLQDVSPAGIFAEQLQDMRLFLWRVPGADPAQATVARR
jgi:SAM-dependent methyltransferase